MHRAAGQRCLRRLHAHGSFRQRQFLVALGTVHRDLHHEPVFLRFGQWIRPFVFNRVLRGEHRKVRRQRVRVAVDGYEPFLHRLQQRRLRLGRRAIDFVGEQKRGEDGAFDEREFVSLQVKDVRARDVRRHEVGGELDAGEVAAENARKRADEQRLGDARHAFNQRVVAGKNRDQGLVHHVALADDDLGDFLPGAGQGFFKLIDGFVHNNSALRTRSVRHHLKPLALR